MKFDGRSSCCDLGKDLWVAYGSGVTRRMSHAKQTVTIPKDLESEDLYPNTVR